MSVVERAPATNEPIFFDDHLSTEAVYEAMQLTAPAGLERLDQWTVRALGNFTQHLVRMNGEKAIEEYDRYSATEKRTLDLPHTQLRDQLQEKTILVTGGTGLIGSILLGELSKFNPARLVSISRGQTIPQSIIPGVEYSRVDVRDEDRLQRIVKAKKPDIIYHVAADKYNHEAEKRVKHTLTTNIFGTENVIAAAEANNVPQIVYASTGKASRPYSPDIYASSKKASEYLMSKAAVCGRIVCSAARFTHVVDHSNVRRKINTWINNGQPVMLQDPYIWFYIQSARESAQLLLNSGLEAKPGVLEIQAIRDLGAPVNLADLGIGAIAKQRARVPLYFRGTIEGYEERPWPFLYGMDAGDYSPLMNSLETEAATASENCPVIDAFPHKVSDTTALTRQLDELRNLCQGENPTVKMRQANQSLSWAMLDARLGKVSNDTLQRLANRIHRYPADRLTDQDIATNHAILAAINNR